MKRSLLATSIALPIVGAVGAIAAMNCSPTVGQLVIPDAGGGGGGGSSSSSGSGSANGSGSSSSSGGNSNGSSSSSSGGDTSSSSSGGSSSGSPVEGGAGSSSSSSSGGTVDVKTIFGMPNAYTEHFDDSFILFPCYGQSGNQDCLTVPQGQQCPNQNQSLPYEDRGRQSFEYFQVGGTPGTMYLATIKVEGVSEAKFYQKGTPSVPAAQGPFSEADTLTFRPAPNVDCLDKGPGGGPDCLNDAFYAGGAPVDFEFYNVYKLTVYSNGAGGDAGAGPELQHYYLNSFPTNAVSGLQGNGYETHKTYYISYTHTIPVVGGGVLEYHTGDTNCRAIDNCGNQVLVQDCQPSQGRSIPNTTVPQMYMGQPVSGFNTHNGASQPFHSHILHIQVIAVKPM